MDSSTQAENNFSIWISLFYLCVETLKFQVGDVTGPHSELDKSKGCTPRVLLKEKETICFVAPGGWEKWDGKTLEKKGLGGTETCIIKFAEYLSRNTRLTGLYNIVIFCNCTDSDMIRGVEYINLYDFPRFSAQFYISYCFINRYPEYIPVCILNDIPNIYLMLHDIMRPLDIIPHAKGSVEGSNLKNIICLTNWHAGVIHDLFPQFKEKISVMSYGIDIDPSVNPVKIPYTFIYPSFPHRGLIPLLEMFPKIVQRYPTATLNVFCDTTHSWSQKNCKEYMDAVDILLKQPNVVNHGWVSESTLKKFWSVSQIWLYPCTFKETYCRCALEAAASKTLAITSDLAALNETVGDRGIIIKGDPSQSKWQERALVEVFNILDNQGSESTKSLIESNYKWVITKKYETVVKEFADLYII